VSYTVRRASSGSTSSAPVPKGQLMGKQNRGTSMARLLAVQAASRDIAAFVTLDVTLRVLGRIGVKSAGAHGGLKAMGILVPAPAHRTTA